MKDKQEDNRKKKSSVPSAFRPGQLLTWECCCVWDQVDAGGTCEVQLSKVKGELVLLNEQHSSDNSC